MNTNLVEFHSDGELTWATLRITIGPFVCLIGSVLWRDMPKQPDQYTQPELDALGELMVRRALEAAGMHVHTFIV